MLELSLDEDLGCGGGVIELVVGVLDLVLPLVLPLTSFQDNFPLDPSEMLPRREFLFRADNTC